MRNPLVTAGLYPVMPLFTAGALGTGLDTSNWSRIPGGGPPLFASPQWLKSQDTFADFAHSASFTFECWIYGSASSSERYWAWGGVAPSTTQGVYTGVALSVSGSFGNSPYSSGVVRALINGTSQFVDWRSTTQLPSTPAWHHVAIVANGPDVLFYIDGVLQSTVAINGYMPTGTLVSDAQPPRLYVGSWAEGIPNCPLGLFLDELAVWSYAKYTGSSFALPSAPYADQSPGILALYHFDGSLLDSAIPPQATSISLSGATAIAVGSSSAPYTVALAPAPASHPTTVTVTPSDGGAGGLFTPTSLQLQTDAPSATFTYTGAHPGAVTLTLTNNSSSPTLANPDPLVVSVVPLATTYTFSGPSGGAAGVASTPFTVAFPLSTGINGTVTVVPSDNLGGGTFNPTAVQLGGGQQSATVTYTPSSGGHKRLSVTNNQGLSDPAALDYLAQGGAATALSLSGPASGAAGEVSAPFDVALYPAGSSVASGITVIPSDGSAGGSFTPPTLVLSSASPSATFTYTPPAGAQTARRVIGLSTSGGLVTAPALYTVLGASSYVKLFAVQYGAAYTGLESVIGYTVYDASGNVLIAHVVGQTREVGVTGIYAASVPLDISWNGVVVFDAPADGVAPAAVVFDVATSVLGSADVQDVADAILVSRAGKLAPPALDI